MMSMSMPLYAQVEQALRSRLGTELHPGDQLPTEDELIAEFGVSRITVRRAIQNLANEGLVEKQAGRGSFAAEPKITQPLTGLTGFVEDMEAQGRTVSADVRLVIETAADAGVRNALGLALGEPVVMIERVRLADGRPVSFDRTWLPAPIGQQVAAADLVTEPIFAVLEDTLDIPLVEATYVLEAVVADAEVADALACEPGDPVFRITRTSFTTGNRPVDHEVLHYRGDAIRFITRLERAKGDGPVAG
jgi:GntR family transcriptional regulator